MKKRPIFRIEGVGKLPFPMEIMWEAKNYGEYQPIEAFIAGYKRCLQQLGFSKVKISKSVYKKALTFVDPRYAFRQGWRIANDHFSFRSL